jgi:phage portal protein BeeE
LAHRARTLTFLAADEVKCSERVFGVPVWLLQNTKTTTFASAREASRSFATLTLAPWCARIEAAFQATVLGAPYRLRFDLASLTRADVESLSAALLRGLQGGWLSPNDARAEMGWPAVESGDDIAPPNTSAAAVGDQPSPADDKIVDIEEHRQMMR